MRGIIISNLKIYINEMKTKEARETGHAYLPGIRLCEKYSIGQRKP
jgi:hypothetical protein